MAETTEYHFVLIDDNEIDLLLHQKTIEMTITDALVSSFNNGEKALSFMKETNPNHKYILLLDINMPIMDGFQFLDAFSQFNNEILSQCKTFLVTSSSNQFDISRAHNNSLVSSMINKPLSKEKILNLLTH